MRWLRRWAALVVVALTACGAARAELRALLVGVSGYPTLPERYRLQGPRNDVLLMRQALLQRGFALERIETLADGVPAAAMPTRDNILGALGRLAAAAQPGDTVFVYFAGHGSRQPADRSTPEGQREPDGMHQTFLPIDVGGWKGRHKHVANAIVNHELRAAVDRISARGAFVWGVFDACHSATLVRGGPSDDVAYRYVDPADLGVQAELLVAGAVTVRGAAAPLGALGEPGAAAGAGTAFFYATQTTERTPEMTLPIGQATQRRHGLFSFVLARALGTAQPMSYRQLAQHVLAEYGSMIGLQVTPLFSGNGLDTLVLSQNRAAVRQWPLLPGSRLVMPAGLLSGVDVGSVLALVPGPLAHDNEAIGHLEVVLAETDRAELRPVGQAGRPAMPAAAVPPGAYLRPARSAPPFRLHIAVDRRGCPRDCVLAAAVSELQQRGIPGVDPAWVEAAGAADIILQQTQNHVFFLSPAAPADERRARGHAPGLALRGPTGAVPAPELAARVAQELHRVARARNLLRVAARWMAEAPTSALRATLQRLPAQQRAAQTFSADAVPTLQGGDRLTLTVENAGSVPLDLTVLYLDAEHGISALFPNHQGESNRLAPGARQVIDEITIHTPPAGVERLLLLAVPSRKLGERADFSFLAQPALTRQRGAEQEDMDLFADAAFADFHTRGDTRPAAPRHGTAMLLFTLNVLR